MSLHRAYIYRPTDVLGAQRHEVGCGCRTLDRFWSERGGLPL